MGAYHILISNVKICVMRKGLFEEDEGGWGVVAVNVGDARDVHRLNHLIACRVGTEDMKFHFFIVVNISSHQGEIQVISSAFEAGAHLNRHSNTLSQ